MNADDADAVRRLYALPPDEFVEARNDAAGQAGSRDEADRIRKLRRPTVSAWAVNLLAADAPGDLDTLAELGERLRAAQAEMRGADLRELSAERNRTVAALVRRASELADEAGHPLAAAAQREVETTLDAAVADPDSAEAVRAGTLTKALAYSGTGFTGATPLVTEPRRAESRTASQTDRQGKPGSRAGATSARRSEAGAEGADRPETKTGGRAGPRRGAGTGKRSTSGTRPASTAGTRSDAQARKESEARREARRRAVAKAEQELETAKRRRTEARDALDAAREHRESAAAERHRLRTELAQAERAVTRADDRVAKAADNVDAAESALDRARHRLTEAKAGRG